MRRVARAVGARRAAGGIESEAPRAATIHAACECVAESGVRTDVVRRRSTARAIAPAAVPNTRRSVVAPPFGRRDTSSLPGASETGGRMPEADQAERRRFLVPDFCDRRLPAGIRNRALSESRVIRPKSQQGDAGAFYDKVFCPQLCSGAGFNRAWNVVGWLVRINVRKPAATLDHC